MNTDDPWTDAGDFELLKNIQGICANPTGIRAVAPDTGNYGSWPFHIDIDIGFWCINGEQTVGGGCEDFKSAVSSSQQAIAMLPDIHGQTFMIMIIPMVLATGKLGPI